MLDAAKAAGNKELEREARESIKNLTSKYHQLSKASGLPTKMERMGSIKGKSVDNFGKSGIMSVEQKQMGAVDVQYIGRIDRSIFEKEFGELQTDEVVLTEERRQHIKDGHIADYNLFEKHSVEILEHPDIILKDEKNDNTVFMIKHVDETNINIVLKLAVFADEKHPKNSIMTAYRIRDKNVKKLENKNKTIYKCE